MRRTKIQLFTPETEWVMTEELTALRVHNEKAINIETTDTH